MKPIKLCISAFGPYKDKVEIDFTKLGSEGIFLITGDTGSGKTTIFDAISFALFGEASGSKRESSSFRSDFALDDVKTFVLLEFKHKGVVYNIERIPRYVRKKKRGEGNTIVGGDASLTYLDKIITGDKSVTEECINILGMNCNQFKQVSMIAQGEFLELLHSKTKDRATIFRHIFGTGIYKAISDGLKNKYLLKKREYEDTAITINGYINGVQLSVELTGEESTDDVLSLLVKEIQSDKDIEKKLEDEKNELFRESSKIVEVISEGKILNDSIFKLGMAKERLLSLLKNKDKVDEKELVIKKNRTIWDLVMPKYLELSKLKEELLDKKSKLVSSEDEYKLVLKDYDDSLVKYSSIKEKLSKVHEYNNIIDDLVKKLSIFDEITLLKDEIIDVNKRLEYCQLMSKREVLDKCKACKELQLDIDELREKISILKDEYVKANEIYISHYDSFLSEQAGVLASNLKKGQKCPVCGSVEHPDLAKMIDSVLTKEELDLEKSNLEDKYHIIDKLRLELIDKEKELEILNKDIFNIDENILMNEINQLEVKCSGIRFDIDKINIMDLEKRKGHLNLIIDEKQNGLDNFLNKDSLNIEINKYKDLIVKLEKEVGVITKNYDNLLKKKSSVESLIKILNEDINRIDSSVDTLEKNYVESYQGVGYDKEEDYLSVRISKEEMLAIEDEVNLYKEELVQVNSNISSLEAIVNKRKKIDLDYYENILKEKNKRSNEIELSLKNINNKILNNSKLYSDLKNVSEKTTKLEQELMIYKDLSDTANGTITGKNKLEFEQYVQAGYFDRVLLMANKRFSYMTEDRYNLRRREESSKVSDRLGLELEVMDFYTGKVRDIKTLSGGESFKAALSLALGMSDIIQEFSGGVVVEAMFIDEGFGSLDDESLEQAMNAIMMLSQGNKIIGIISHVNELKNRIDKKIVVKKSNNGSSVSLMV